MAKTPRAIKDFPPPVGTVSTLNRRDGLARIRILRRPDGLFELREERVHEYEDVSYWAGGRSSRCSGVYGDLNVAEREARAIPGFGDATLD